MVGQIISQYKILEKLGEGGMGIVYKAQDTKLDRFVALKFLPPHLAASEQDKARFIQEAKSAAALNHPNVCSIIDIQEVDAQMFIVMEFVDGQTLQEKKSTLTQKQAIDYGIQIAEGLAAAHEKGIVHRDIKPENIMIRKDGIVQVMDFGLAKLVGASRLTKVGSTVGTLGYMSPEQVQGQETTHRSDIFSFGVLLYEMLTGKSPFTGAHESAILYEIVNVDVPPPSTVKPELDPELDRIVMECMEKEPNERMQSIKQVAIDLNRFKRTSSRTRLSRTFSTGTMSKQTPAANGLLGLIPSVIRQQPLPWLITISVIVCTAVLFFLFRSQFAGSGSSVSRVNIAVLNSPEQQIVHADIPSMTLSPDGKYFVYTVSEKGATQLYIRSLNSFQGIPIKGTENGTSPFFSPDGQWIGFTADGKIKKVPTTGGAVELICDVGGFRGATWGTDNRIYFSAGYSTGLSSVMSNGSDVKVFSSMDSTHKDRTHRWPQFIQDGRWVLYTVGDMSSPNSYVDALLVIQSAETGEKHVLDVRGEMARYVEPGYLVVARNGSLLAAPFSLKDFRVSRPLSVVVSDVNCDPGSGNTDFTISDNGQLVYLNGTMNKDLELVWVSRDGNVTAVPTPSQPFNTPRISPDGKKLALSIGINSANDNDLWIYDLAKNVLNRLTFTKRMFAPLWNTDGKTIYYANAASGSEGLMMQAADGSTAPISLLQSVVPRYPISISPNGKQLIFNTVGGPTGEGSILILDRDKGNAVTPLISGRGYYYGGSISPDGRYIAYGSSETGTLEAYVQTYPDLKGKWQISLNGGIVPMWSPTGNEIFFVNTVGKMMSVSVKTAPSFTAEKPKELFDVSSMYFPNIPINNFDVSSDGKKFIMLRNSTSNNKMSSFNYVVNWIEELKKSN